MARPGGVRAVEILAADQQHGADPTNLAASAIFRDTRQLYAYLTTRLADLPGLQSVESAPIIGTIKRTGRVEAVP